MRLQLIASEVTQIPEPINSVRDLFLVAESIQTVNTTEDIDQLNHILAIGLPEVHSQKFETVNLSSIEAKVKIAKVYYDPNSVHDNFI